MGWILLRFPQSWLLVVVKKTFEVNSRTQPVKLFAGSFSNQTLIFLFVCSKEGQIKIDSTLFILCSFLTPTDWFLLKTMDLNTRGCSSLRGHIELLINLQTFISQSDCQKPELLVASPLESSRIVSLNLHLTRVSKKKVTFSLANYKLESTGNPYAGKNCVTYRKTPTSII